MYREDESDHKIVFYDQENKKICNYWAIPSFKEIMEIESQSSEFFSLNRAELYQFELGDPEKKDEFGDPLLPEFATNKQKELVKARLPTLTIIDIATAEGQLMNHQRLVEFQECYKFTGNRALNYLFYMRQFQNLFDLEFFANKLPSKSFSIAGLEQSVLSGSPFWEDG